MSGLTALWVILLPIAVVVLLGGLNYMLRQRLPLDDTPLVDALDAVLPQTQCAQCGYPGCRPYAEAIAAGEAATNLCPPGGKAVADELARLTQTDGASSPPEQTHGGVAFIREADCIGCTLCLPPCPVDAIVGSQGHMHTVLQSHCTGCELCIPACPVDCIEFIPLAQNAKAAPSLPPRSAPGGCIRCGACDPVCPVHLPVQALYEQISHQRPDWAEEHGLSRCIECGLCDEACPSSLPLQATFTHARQAGDRAAVQAEQQRALKARYEQHTERLRQAELDKQARRSQRMRERSRTWEQG